MNRLSRRDMVSLIVAAIAITPNGAWADTGSRGENSAVSHHLALLNVVADLVIPRNDTDGAVGAGVPAWVILALSCRLAPSDTSHPSGLMLLEWLDHKLGNNFSELPWHIQNETLKIFDANEYKQHGSPWIAIKSLIVMGYYTSEIGGEKELDYELVPGRFDPDLPLKPGDRAYSSDWTAVTYG